MGTQSFYFGPTMPWMVIKGGNKPRQLNEHTENKTDLKQQQQTIRKKKSGRHDYFILGHWFCSEKHLISNQCRYAAIWGQRDAEEINYKTPFQQW